MTRIVLLAAAMASLGGSALAAETAARDARNGGGDRIVCRKMLETGSLVKKNKQCFTLSEWDKIYAANREGNEKTRAQLSGGFNCQANGTC